MKILFSVSGIKKSAYYKWLSGIQNRLKRDHENQQIIEAIKELYDINKGEWMLMLTPLVATRIGLRL